MSSFNEYVGRSRTCNAVIDPWPARALLATLDLGAPEITDELPILWHWQYFLETAPHGQIGVDGHPKRGAFLPPVPLPRRMFAGARTRVHTPLKLGKEAELTETIKSITEKTNKNGPLVIVTVNYRYTQDETLRIDEDRDFIYLPSDPKKSTQVGDVKEEAVPEAAWQLSLSPDPTLLFRYSALTFNSHRIHYDLEYATKEEGYPGLVVQGPFSATLLAEFCRLNLSSPIRQFSFRAQSPLFCGKPLHLRADPQADGSIDLAIYSAAGQVALSANASTTIA